MSKKIYLLLVALSVIVLAGGISFWYYSQPQQTTPPQQNNDQGRDDQNGDQQDRSEDEEVPVQSKYENKVVYTTSQDVNVENLKQDCRDRDGEFNECGSVCGPRADTCASVCAYTCEFGGDEGRDDKFGKWENYTDEEEGFSIDHPSALKVEETSSEIAKFTLLGPTQREGTEIFDGISVIITKATHTQESLKDHVDSRIEETSQIGEITEEPERVVLNGNNGYRYQKVTAGSSTVLTFPISEKEVIKISYSAPDPGGRGYKKIAEEIVESFELLGPQDRADINLYYVQAQSPDSSCDTDSVTPVTRTIDQTDNLIRDTIKLLLQGDLDSDERREGFSTEFSGDHQLELESADLEEGVLTLKLSDPDKFTSGGSCRVELLRSQIEKTGLQFFPVQEVRIRPETLFQP